VAHQLPFSSPDRVRTGAKENPAEKQFHANLSNI